MKLSFEQIKSVTVGAVRIWQEDEEIRFSKCTQKQVDAWYALQPILGERAETTTGVRLDLHTSSRSFTFTAPRGSKFEVYINNTLRHIADITKAPERTYTVRLDGEYEENRITLIFPAHELGTLSSVTIDYDATLTPHKFDRKLLFIGDSITQGWDSGYDSLSYAYRTSRFFNADSVIHGVGGGYFHESIVDSALTYEPDAVIIAFGTNDWHVYKSIDTLREQSQKFLDGICKQYAGKPIIGISPIWRGDTDRTDPAAGSFEDVCRLVKEQIVSHGMHLVDGMTLTPHLSAFFADVVLHPNALGFGIYAETLAAAIKDII